MNLSPSDDRSVETTSSDKSSNENNETDSVVVLAIVELDGLFDDCARLTTPASDGRNNDTFLTKIRIYQSELLLVVPPVAPSGGEMVSGNDSAHPTSYIFTAQQLRNKINCHFAGRIIIPSVAAQNDATAFTRSFGDGDEGCYQVYIFNNTTNAYVPLPEDNTTNVIPLFGTRWRLRVTYKADDRFQASSKKAPVPLLAIQGRYFAEDIQADGTVRVGEYHLQVLPPSPVSAVDAHVCTGYHVWDGAILLMRYLQSMRQHTLFHQNQHFLELGSGCGVVGMSASLLGARSVTLTDLPELLPFLQANVDANLKNIEHAREQQVMSLDCVITCESCDWTEQLPHIFQKTLYDVILVADCIWIESLVLPLFDTLKNLTENDTNYQRNHPISVIDDSSKVSSRVPETILEHEVISSSGDAHILLDPIANCSISHMDLGKSKTSLDESPVNSDADIYHQQSSQQLSGLVHFQQDNNSSISNTMDQSLSSMQMENDSKPSAASLLLVEQELQDPDMDDSEPYPAHIGHGTTVLISYQRRGKSTHETFMRELNSLFSDVQSITVPNFDYPQDIFYLYSCRR